MSKKKTNSVVVPEILDDGVHPDDTPPGFKYSVRTIWVTVKGILTTGAGFRGVSAVLSLVEHAFGSFVETIAAAYTTGRQWLQKLGLYKLLRPKDQTGIWIHIVDATVQMGAQKAVLILGLRIDGLEPSLNPNFEQLEPLVLKVVTSCPGEVIAEALDEASERTGEPAAVLSDQGAEMNRGTRLRSSTVPMVHIHDCLHKLNNLLKAILKEDEQWSEFKTRATAMTQDVKLSYVAHLAPPKQRSKARLMASVHLVRWGSKLLGYLDSKPDLPDKLKEKLEWIIPYKEKIQEWMSMHAMVTTAIEAVLEVGYQTHTLNEWKRRGSHIKVVNPALNKMYQGIKLIIKSETEKIPEDAIYPGCSAIIESIFGKFKSLENHFSSSGLTELILALPALAGPTTYQDIFEAMVSIHVKDVKVWLHDNVGQTYQTRRRADLQVACDN